MRKFVTLLVMCALLGVLTGCATTSTSTSVAIPSDSPFSKIQPGMGVNQMFDIIGVPTDREKKIHPSSWFVPITIYYDIFYYKGLGRVEFDGPKINKIIYDPTEDGYQ